MAIRHEDGGGSRVDSARAAATLLRFWRLRAHLDRRVFLGFGLTNAAGALAGGLLHTVASSPALTVVLGGLLMFAGGVGLAGYTDRLRLGRMAAWVAGAVSGGFGGLVGNQGGLRSAAMLGLGVRKEAFVATATAIALAVDAARMPFYFVTEAHRIAGAGRLVAAAAAGVLAGTLAGESALRRIPEKIFRRVVSAILLGIGAALLYAAINPLAAVVR